MLCSPRSCVESDASAAGDHTPGGGRLTRPARIQIRSSGEPPHLDMQPSNRSRPGCRLSTRVRRVPAAHHPVGRTDLGVATREPRFTPDSWNACTASVRSLSRVLGAADILADAGEVLASITETSSNHVTAETGPIEPRPLPRDWVPLPITGNSIDHGLDGRTETTAPESDPPPPQSRAAGRRNSPFLSAFSIILAGSFAIRPVFHQTDSQRRILQIS